MMFFKVVYASLFLDQKEYELVIEKISKNLQFSYPHFTNQRLYLSGILFEGPEDYTFWINEKSYGVNSLKINDNILIKEVNVNFIVLEVDQETIKLHVNQTLETRNRKVFQGDTRIAIFK